MLDNFEVHFTHGYSDGPSRSASYSLTNGVTETHSISEGDTCCYGGSRSHHGDPTSISQQRLRDVFEVFLNMLLDCGALADFAAAGWSHEERIRLLRRMFLSALR